MEYTESSECVDKGRGRSLAHITPRLGGVTRSDPLAQEATVQDDFLLDTAQHASPGQRPAEQGVVSSGSLGPVVQWGSRTGAGESKGVS